MNLEKTNTEPNVQDAAVQPREKKSASRSSLKSEEQKIVAFLQSCEPYQADAIRVIIEFAYDPKKPKELSEQDAIFVNRFLNFGADVNLIKSADDLSKYRTDRMSSLLTSSDRFCERDSWSRIAVSMSTFAVNPTIVRASFEQLKKSPANS
jgi:leucyl-tRNA synthetase